MIQHRNTAGFIFSYSTFFLENTEAVSNDVASDDAQPAVIPQHNSSDFTL
jgi:hypothetical protein